MKEIFTYLIITANIVVAFALGRQFPNGPDFTPSPLIAHYDKIDAQLNSALSTLANCTNFKKVYPKERAALLKVKRIKIAHKKEHGAYASSIAYTYAGLQTIVLTDHFFKYSPEEQEAILVHELLHIARVPTDPLHNVGNVNDPVYILSRDCTGIDI